jgi:hypothetical protein
MVVRSTAVRHSFGWLVRSMMSPVAMQDSSGGLCGKLPFTLIHSINMTINRKLIFDLSVTVVSQSRTWVMAASMLKSWVRIPLKTWMFVIVFLC